MSTIFLLLSLTPVHLLPQLQCQTQLDKSCLADVSGTLVHNAVPLYILHGGRKAHAHWMFLNGQTQNSMGGTSSYLREKACQAITGLLWESASNPFWRVY